MWRGVPPDPSQPAAGRHPGLRRLPSARDDRCRSLLQLFVTVIVLGLEPLAAAVIGYLVAFNGFFQHWNVRTPQWLGYLIQRPESHCVHHRMGVHYYNYSDFPPWDMLFGTFRNPREVHGRLRIRGGRRPQARRDARVRRRQRAALWSGQPRRQAEIRATRRLNIALATGVVKRVRAPNLVSQDNRRPFCGGPS